MTGGRLERDAGLVVASAREPLLALAAGLGASLHVSLPDLRLHDALPRQPGDREATLADEQYAPGRGRSARLREGSGVGRAGVRPGEGWPGLERGPILRATGQPAVGDTQLGLAVPGHEVAHPAFDSRRGNQNLPSRHAVGSRSARKATVRSQASADACGWCSGKSGLSNAWSAPS